MTNRKLLIGVDVGGTNSDLVVLDPTRLGHPDRGVLAWHKSVTTPDVSVGIQAAIKTILENPNNHIEKSEIVSVTIGTTHFINAVIERDSSRLEKVAVIRLSGPYGRHMPPFGDFPEDLAEIINGYYCTLDGGCRVDGKDIKPLDEDGLRKECANIKTLGITAVAVVATFANINNDHELRATKIIKEALPNVDVVMSHTISGLGFIERENASILNASIKKFGRKIIKSFIHATKEIGLNCTVLLSQNDGTVLSTKDALETPIRTFSSGATNSMRGAAILCSDDPDVKNKSVIVCDIGGTTSDVGQLLPSGFPRQSSTFSYVGGVKMNFSMPHVESVGLGGGSIVRDQDGKLTAGPDSTGADIIKEAILFGGDIVTTSDVNIGKRVDEFGVESLDPALKMGTVTNVKGRFTDEFKIRYDKVIATKFERIIDRMKTSPDPIPVIFVGGGSFIAPDTLEGTSKVIKPPFYQVANAIGAALGKVSCTITEMKSLADFENEKTAYIEKLIHRATEDAINKGAMASSINVVSIISDAVPYVDKVYKFEVKVVGDVDYESALSATQKSVEQVVDDVSSSEGEEVELVPKEDEYVLEEIFKSAKVSRVEKEITNYAHYKPTIINGEWLLSEIDIDFISTGAYILGCGGGGDPGPESIELKRIIKQGGKLRIVTLDEFERKTEGKGTAINVGYCGSPVISSERLHGSEMIEAVSLIERWEGKKTDGIFMFEIGGGNGLSGIWTAFKMGLPCVDLDLMGRAYPTQWQSLPSVVHDLHGYPYVSLSDGNGMSMLITSSEDDVQMEDVIRDAMYNHGVQCAVVEPSMTCDEMRNETIFNPISNSWRIGRAVHLTRAASDIDSLPTRIIEAVGGSSAAKCLLKGKIIGVEKMIKRGYGYGVVVLQSTEGDETKIRIPFKNENIVCYKVNEDGSEVPLCCVPDLITLVDNNGNAIGTQDYQYGLLVYLMVFAPSDKWTTAKGIEIGGPRAFGELFYDLEYKSIGKYIEPVPIAEEYS
ncbi:uncharacterized protein KLLA0_D00528g [Kluyveromyces lactis]|uniref:KLLA0D00528p n=1 Tax=Kluyveromyces lactis (strain ATCC 8585 / CBS 2359 / DSM 70799 / NBRC 1267 / NRRL Y-1140 / WM37) TaxID=284590 RepID=Q6CSJ4_KLULA|nr:uncharacterized protein KLLA0_D00528g [Kluyveromyces lactis]CAH00191.1 KLLA0D00528p [Kluyveromyces lactis]|eukprot:XP_453095.1 uncharacterized protein KLLA0_D00528g [Kluyveromyces lactis]